MAKVLYVEDDYVLGSTVVEWLEYNHHLVEWVKDGAEALERIRFYEYDILVVDLTIPEISGLEICETYRKEGGTAPVIILSGRGTMSDKQKGYDVGVDDYMTKPFDLKELTLRIRALSRRSSPVSTNTLKARHIEVDPTLHTVKKQGEEIHLAPMEFDLLEALLRSTGEPLSSEALMTKISKEKSSGEIVRTLLRRLRKKIDVQGEPSMISNVHGVGYEIAGM